MEYFSIQRPIPEAWFHIVRVYTHSSVFFKQPLDLQLGGTRYKATQRGFPRPSDLRGRMGMGLMVCMTRDGLPRRAASVFGHTGASTTKTLTRERAGDLGKSLWSA